MRQLENWSKDWMNWLNNNIFWRVWNHMYEREAAWLRFANEMNNMLDCDSFIELNWDTMSKGMFECLSNPGCLSNDDYDYCGFEIGARQLVEYDGINCGGDLTKEPTDNDIYLGPDIKDDRSLK